MAYIEAPPAGTAAAAPARRWWALGLLSVAQFMVVLDVTVVNVALPEIGRDLALDRQALTWVVTAYTLSVGGLLLLGGRLADVAGRRRMFLVGLATFTLASLASGLSGTGGALVAARAAQGVGAALLSPAALSIVTTTFHGRERHRALGVWAAIGGAGAAAGVLLGGVLTSGPGWAWVFFVNIPVGITVAAALPATVGPVPGTGGAHRLDLRGALSATLAVGLAIYGLVEAGDAGWGSPTTLAALAAGAALAGAFLLVERSAPAPLVPLGLAARRPVMAGNLVMLVASGLLLAAFFVVSQYLQHALGLSALRTGLMFLPVAIAIALGTHLGARLVGRHGSRPAAAGGFALAAAGLALLSRVPGGGQAAVHVLPGFVVAGLGLGAAFVAATTTTLANVEARHAGVASGMISTGHELGASLGVALVSTIAGASLDAGAHGGVPVGGFGDALTAAAAVAALAAALVLRLVPAGRPAAGPGPVLAH
ncbi:MAG TPA: MFS transporter [Acidimicrobiales bacterium]